MTFLCVLLFPVNNLAADAAIGKLTIVEDIFTVKRPGNEKTIEAVVGGDIFIGDVLQTGKDSRAQLTFIDNSFVNLSSETRLRVDQYTYAPDKNSRRAVIKVIEGKARVVFFRQRETNPSATIKEDDSSITVEAGNARVSAGWGGAYLVPAKSAENGNENAAVQPPDRTPRLKHSGAGIRGQTYIANIVDFVAVVSPVEAEVAVLDGAVNVENISYLTVGKVQLGINQKTVVKEKTPPSKPAPITPAQRKSYMKDARNF